jgi:hypothetical protein
MDNMAVDIIEIVKNPSDYPVEIVSSPLSAMPAMIRHMKYGSITGAASFIQDGSESSFYIPERYNRLMGQQFQF